jgi:CRP-like cAMP-binding protein
MSRLSQHATDLIHSLSLFRALDSSAMRRICEGTTQMDAPRGTIMLRRGDRCCNIYVVSHGRVKLSLETQRGNEKVIALLGPRKRFGDALVYSGQPCLATAETLVDSTILCIPRQVVVAELSANADFARGVIEDLSRRLYQRTKDV